MIVANIVGLHLLSFCYLTILLHVTDPALVDALTIGAGELGVCVALHVGALSLVAPVPAVVLVVAPPVLRHTLTRLASEIHS